MDDGTPKEKIAPLAKCEHCGEGIYPEQAYVVINKAKVCDKDECILGYVIDEVACFRVMPSLWDLLHED